MTERQNKIREMMDNVILKNNFQVGRVYPGDLKCDDEFVRSFGNGSAQIGWVVGDTHTYIVALGIHPELNKMVHSYVAHSRNDKLYKLTLAGAEDLKFVEVDKTTFASLSKTNIPYSKASSDNRDGFVLLKNGIPIINVSFRKTGAFDKRVYQVKLKPLNTINDLDRFAGEAWANLTLGSEIQSLFFQTEVEWEEVAIEFQSSAVHMNSKSLSLF